MCDSSHRIARDHDKMIATRRWELEAASEMRYSSWKKTTIALILLAACSSDATEPAGLPPLFGISVSLSTSTLLVGQSTQAYATLRDSIGRSITVAGDTVNWLSSNPAVASISPKTGTITALAVGTTSISASARGKVGMVDLVVTGPGGAGSVSSLNVTLAAPTLHVGHSMQATAIPKDSAGNSLVGRPISWSSSDANIAAVSSEGMVSGSGVGTASISATSEGMTGTASVTITAPSLVSTLSLALNASTIQVGVVAQGTVTARDSVGDVVSGLPTTWATSDAEIAAVSPTGAVTGLSFGAVTISATVDGQTASAALEVAPPAVATVTIVIAPEVAAGDSIVATTILRDEDGNALTDRPVTWTVNNPGVATVSPTTGVVTGVAVGYVIVTATSENQTGNALVHVAEAGTAVGGGGSGGGGSGGGSPPAGGGGGGTPTPTATSLAVVTQPSSTTESGSAFDTQPRVQVRDGSGSAFSQAGVVVVAAIASGSGFLGGTTIATTNVSGVATFTNLKITGPTGSRTLSFSATALAPAISGAISVTAAAATKLTISSQASASAQTGVAFSTQPSVQLRDASNNSVAQSGVVVTASIASGSGTLGGSTTATTNGSGVATFSNLRITGSGSYTLRFTVSGLTSVTSSTITLGAGAPTTLTITTQPSSSATSGAVFSRQPVVQVRDALNNTVNQSGIVVAASIVSGGGSLGGTTHATTNSSGVATFVGLSITGATGGRTLSFDASSLSGATSASVTVTAAAAAQLAVATQPSSSAQSGTAFATQPAIRLQDASGNSVSQSGVVVTASIATGSGTLAGTLTATTNASGVATFTNLRITGSGAHTLHFVAAGLVAVNCGTIAVTAAAVATQVAITSQPSSSSASGVAFSQQPVVQLRDASNHAFAQSGVVVTVAIASGGGTLGGTKTASTNSSGVATFTNLAITGSAGSRTLSFSAPSLTAATSTNVTISVPAVATKLGIMTQPSSSATSGAALSSQPAIQLRDASNNAVGQSGVVVAATIASGSGSLGGSATATTNSSGVATFSNLSISGSGSYTLGFGATGLASTTSSTVAVTTGGGGGFATPNIMNNGSFETGWEGFTNGAAGTPTSVRDNSMAAPGGGSWSFRESWTPNSGGDAGTNTFYDFSGSDHVWVRFYFRLTAPITTIMKFMRFDSEDGRNTHLGGLFIGSGNNIITFGADQENGAAQTQLGLSQSQVTDGQWHSIEMEYWRNGDPSGYPSVAFWFDGNAVGFPDGQGGVAYPSEMDAHWVGGRLNVGQRGSSKRLGSIEWLSTLNKGNTTSGQINIDRVSVSTAGRIGP
jgi:uncharacterized protein YjdB